MISIIGDRSLGLTQVKIREVQNSDITTIHQIYSYHVMHGLGTFEEEAPSLDEMSARLGSITKCSYPYLVAELNGKVVGFAYASTLRDRSGFRFTVEDSIYVANECSGLGVGQQLLRELINRCQQLGFQQMVAVIGDSANAGSINLHKKCGFQLCGIMNRVGYKFAQWVDVVIMELKLN